MSTSGNSAVNPAAVTQDGSAAAAMKRNGKSFWFASLFLPRDIAADAFTLYHFCRMLDDIADGESVEGDVASQRVAQPGSERGIDARDRLIEVKCDLRQRQSKNLIVQQFLEVAARRAIELVAAEHLLDALLRDASEDREIADEAELIRYCYGVAGTVGLMMASILGAPEEAFTSAVDLGIAMQLTNIARDVMEDARNGRRYLPASWFASMKSPSAPEIATMSEYHDSVAKAVSRSLTLADCYYASAANGFAAIPRRGRNAIRIAAAVYREIGIVLRENQCRWWMGRSYVPLGRKLRIAAGLYGHRSALERLVVTKEAAALHSMIADMPGVH